MIISCVLHLPKYPIYDSSPQQVRHLFLALLFSIAFVIIWHYIFFWSPLSVVSSVSWEIFVCFVLYCVSSPINFQILKVSNKHLLNEWVIQQYTFPGNILFTFLHPEMYLFVPVRYMTNVSSCYMTTRNKYQSSWVLYLEHYTDVEDKDRK